MMQTKYTSRLVEKENHKMKVVNIRVQNRCIQMEFNVCVENISQIMGLKNNMPMIIIGDPNDVLSISIPFDAVTYMSVEEV